MTELALGLLVAVALAAVDRTRGGEDRSDWSLTFPRTATADEATASFRSLTGLLPRWWRRLTGSPVVLLETRADAAGIGHVLCLPNSSADYVVGAMKAALPGVRLAPLADRPSRSFAVARELRLKGRGDLRTAASAETNATILASLQPLQDGELVVIQYAISPVPQAPFAGAQRLGDFLAGRAPEVDPKAASREPELATAIRIGIVASGRRADHLASRVLGAFHPLGTSEIRLARRLLPTATVAGRIERGAAPDIQGMVLRADELAAMVAFPLEAPELAGVTLGRSKDLTPTSGISRSGLVLGDATAGETGRPLAVSLEEARRGMHLVAPTGAGKSTVLLNLASQLMSGGNGVVVIDSKGDLVSDLADRIPESRRHDTIVFDPADTERPLGFNLLGGVGDTDLIVDHVVGQFRARFGATGLGPRSEDILRAALMTLSREPGMTLCEVEPLLANAAFRHRLIGKLDEPVLESFWAWYGSLSDAARAEAIAPLSNKIRTYTLRRRVRSVIGQSRGLDLASVLAEQQVLLISLAKGSTGEDAAALLGAAITSRLWSAIQARTSLPATQRKPVMVICDEFQDFARLPIGIGDAVAQSRGYGVGWVLAHQHLAQLDAETRQGVLANCRTKLVMQTTSADARAFAREFAPYLDASDLQGLGPYEGYAAVSTGASVAPPASLKTRPAPKALGSAASVRQASRSRYGTPPEKTEQAIRERVASARQPTPIGGIRRAP